MTLHYVRSGAAGAATGADWANAYLTLAAAMTAAAAGDDIFVAADHAETQASAMTLTSAGTAAAPVRVICVDHTGTVPPVPADLRTTATVSTTGNSNINFSGAGSHTYYYGITFNASSSTGTGTIVLPNSDDMASTFENCVINLRGSASSARMFFGTSTIAGALVFLKNTVLSFAHTTQTINLGVCVVIWEGGSIGGSVFPTILFNSAASCGTSLTIRGVDLSALGSGKTVVSAISDGFLRASIEDCKIDAAVTLFATPGEPGNAQFEAFRCSATGINYQQKIVGFTGTLDHETTIIRTGGANDGTTGLAWKIDTSANANEAQPFISPPIAIWNDVDGSAVTATVEGIWGGGAVPDDDEIWLEVEYLGDNSSPKASFVHDGRATPLTTAAAQTASNETWGGSTTDFQLAVTFTPQQKGWIFARIKAAKPSDTFYIDPKVTLS